MYVGLHMLARAQREEMRNAIEKIAQKSNFIRHVLKEEQSRLWPNATDLNIGASDTQTNHLDDGGEAADDPFQHHTTFRNHRRQSMLVLCANDESSFDICERDVFGTDDAEQLLMKEAAKYAVYAQVIYSRLKKFVTDEGMVEQNATNFIREPNKLFERDFKLEGIGCERATLCYANFDNGIVSTPYAIIVDEELKKIVLTIRGTISIDDIVCDFQYNPISLEKTGKICGFDGEGHYCHTGFLTRCKYLYNDIKK